MAPAQHTNDGQKSCLELQTEIYSTHLKAGEKLAHSQDKKRTNIFLGLAVPLALNMDVSSVDWKEAKALGRRRNYLTGLFNQFGCKGYLGFGSNNK